MLRNHGDFLMSLPRFAILALFWNKSYPKGASNKVELAASLQLGSRRLLKAMSPSCCLQLATRSCGHGAISRYPRGISWFWSDRF